MTYPGTMDLFSALKRAMADLKAGVVKYAIVGASCDQKNFLVKHHINRTQPEYREQAIDCSAAIVLTTEDIEGIGEFESIEMKYQAFDPFSEEITLLKENPLPAFCGPVTGLVYLGLQLDDHSSQKIHYRWEGNRGQMAAFTVRRLS